MGLLVIGRVPRIETEKNHGRRRRAEKRLREQFEMDHVLGSDLTIEGLDRGLIRRERLGRRTRQVYSGIGRIAPCDRAGKNGIGFGGHVASTLDTSGELDRWLQP